MLLAYVAWYKSIQLLYFVGCMFFSLALVNAWIARRMTKSVAVSRSDPEQIFAGTEIPMFMVATNSTGRTATVLLQEDTNTERNAWFLPSLPTGGTASLASSKFFATRGKHFIPAINASSSFPFGIVTWQRKLLDKASVIVLPKIGTVDLAAFRRWMARNSQMDGRSRRPALLQASEVAPS